MFWPVSFYTARLCNSSLCSLSPYLPMLHAAFCASFECLRQFHSLFFFLSFFSLLLRNIVLICHSSFKNPFVCRIVRESHFFFFFLSSVNCFIVVAIFLLLFKMSISLDVLSLVHYKVSVALMVLFCRCIIVVVQETPHFLCWYVHFTHQTVAAVYICILYFAVVSTKQCGLHWLVCFYLHCW